jgi:hypothetical protein
VFALTILLALPSDCCTTVSAAARRAVSSGGIGPAGVASPGTGAEHGIEATLDRTGAGASPGTGAEHGIEATLDRTGAGLWVRNTV